MDESGYTRIERYQAGQNLRSGSDLWQDWTEDSVPNLWKLRHNFSPTDGTVVWLDNDSDGWINLVEYMRGTDPFVPDESPESLRDRLEAQAASHLGYSGGSGGPGSGVVWPEPGIDNDSDGVDDLTELKNGTNPNDASSVFAAWSASCPEAVSTM